MMTEKTQLNRLPERAVTESENVYATLDEGMVCHASYVIEDRPVVIPTLYVRDEDRLLLHGSNTSGLAKAVRRGSPLSVAVTHLDALVVARTGFHSSANYRSVVVHGQGRLLTGDERTDAFDIIVEKLIPGRTADIRAANESEIKQTAVIELTLDEHSAKTRTGDPKDEPEDLDSDAWAGIVPVHVVYGDPEPAADLRPGISTPEYLEPYKR